MNKIVAIFENIISSYSNMVVLTSTIAAVLVMVFALSTYEFFVYRMVSHRAFYNKSFNICIAVVPYFIATIILCLQSSLVITLGTIGALAIIRFRAAVKDPVDMLYLLWSIHIGITCGCQLYEVAVLTSLIVTVVLLAAEHIKFGKTPVVLVVHCSTEQEAGVLNKVQAQTKRYRVKSRTYSGEGCTLVVEVSMKDPQVLAAGLQQGGIEKFSIIEYDNDDVL